MGAAKDKEVRYSPVAVKFVPQLALISVSLQRWPVVRSGYTEWPVHRAPFLSQC